MAEIIYTSNAPEALGPYSQAIVTGNMVFTSGQIAINPATNTVEAVLTQAGSSFDKAVKTTCFLKNMSDFAAFNGIYGKYFTSKPARSCVAVKELPKDVLVEVEVIAEK